VVCPTQAIISGDLDNPQSRISQIKSRTQVSARKVEKGTQPALFYIDGDVDSLDPLQTDTESAYLWSQQNRGVAQHAPTMPDHIHPLDRLGELLSLGESDEFRARDREKLLETVLSDQSPRRAYDAPQKGITWGWQVTSYLWTKGVSAGVLALPLLAQALGGAAWSAGAWVAAMLTSLIFLGLTGLLLIADLEQPKRFLYVLLRPQWRSWLVKGAYIITAFSGAIFMHTAIAWWFPQTRLEWFSQWLVIGLSAMTAMYTAFLFAQAKGRDFWQSPVLPIQMLAHSVMLGAAVLMLAAPFCTAEWNSFVVTSLVLSTLVHLFCDWIELTLTHSTRAAKQAAKMMTRGRFRRLFWGGNVLLGAALPLLICLLGWSWLLPVAGLMVMVGVYVSQHLLVYVPQQIPLS
jgi:formate-dependent nitrite reductase membrane component NrfD